MGNSSVEERAQRIFGAIAVLFLIGFTIYVVTTGGKDPLAFLIFVIALPAFVIIGIFLGSMPILRVMRLLRMFKSAIRIEGQRLILPGVLMVEQGIVNIMGEWIEWIDRYATRYRVSRVYNAEIAVPNSVKQMINHIDLRELCNQPSLVYIDADNNVLIEAPRLIISSGKFENIGMICLDTSNIPRKKIELSAGDYLETVNGTITLVDEYLEASLKWSSTHLAREAIYDHKRSISTVANGIMVKPTIQGATLEICVGTSQKTSCKPLLKLSKPGKSSIRIALFKASKMPVVFYAGEPSRTHEHRGPQSKRAPALEHLEELIKDLKKLAPRHARKTILGYRPGSISFRLILNRLGVPDKTREIVL